MTDRDILFMGEAVKQSFKSYDPVNDKRVGCVIVNRGVIVGTGFRNLFIVKERPHLDICFHAEHIALMEAGENARGGTLYCTMEPCKARHIGFSNAGAPPESCCDMIIKLGIVRVVFFVNDNEVGSGGRAYLQKAGIEVSQITLL